MSSLDHCVYRFYNADGKLLYVGVTSNLSARLGTHRRDKPWWPEVAEIRVGGFPSRYEATAEENRAILAEWPRYNISGPSAYTREPPEDGPRQKVSFYVAPAVLAELRRCAGAVPPNAIGGSLSGLVEQALLSELGRLRKEWNSGKPFEDGTASAPTGRPRDWVAAAKPQEKHRRAV